jgi:hypothetical protein
MARNTFGSPASLNRGLPSGHETASHPASTSAPFGKVYTPRELAKLWQLSEQSIRRLFQDEPDVFVMGSSKRRGRRAYQTLRIPESVALRVWRARCGERI